MKDTILLFIPPYGDFTQPYHSVSYVAPYLRRAGFDVDIIDLNIRWIIQQLSPGAMAKLEKFYNTQWAKLQNYTSWTLTDQMLATDCINALAIINSVDFRKCVNTLQDNTLFYNYDAYLEARSHFRWFERLMTIRNNFFNFSTAFEVPPIDLSAESIVAAVGGADHFIGDITDIIGEFAHGKSYFACGLSAQFSANVRPGFACLSALKKAFPNAHLIAGGSAVSHIVKNARNFEALAPLASLADYLFVGDAEIGLGEFIKSLALNSVGKTPHQVINLRSCSGDVESFWKTGHQFEASDHESKLPPDYSWVIPSDYLSPEIRINYAPTRGCHWNQCSFCDYGLLTTTPAGTYRAAEPQIFDNVLDQAKDLGVRHIFFATDTATVRHLTNACKSIEKSGRTYFWSTQIYLNRALNDSALEYFKSCGLITLSFGLESGSDKVLQAMGKGANRVLNVLEPFLEIATRHAIPLQPMYFFGFPGEERIDRELTVDFLNRHREGFAFIPRANYFDLTPNSIVAKNPHEYGIVIEGRPAYDLLAGGLSWRYADGMPSPTNLTFSSDIAKISTFLPFERPWVGGLDSHHTSLYLRKHGPAALRSLVGDYVSWKDKDRLAVRISLESRFDLARVLENVNINSWVCIECNNVKASMSMGEDLDIALSALALPLEAELESTCQQVYFH